MKKNLHTLLASAQDRKKLEATVLNEAVHTLKTKDTHFRETIRSYEPMTENELQMPEEITPMVTTVDSKLDYVWQQIHNSIDSDFMIEKGDAAARADIIVDDKVFEVDVPIGALINLKKHLDTIKLMYKSIPTLAPGTKWEKDNTRDNVFVAPHKVTYKTKKEESPLELYPATKEHPAQVKPVIKDVPTHKIITSNASGEWTSSQKSAALGRIEKLQTAVTEAIAEANKYSVEVEDSISKRLQTFIKEDNV